MRASESYLVTWTTHGTWRYDGLVVTPDLNRLPLRARAACAAEPRLAASVVLDHEQRKAVERAIQARCKLRNWKLHAVKARSNHVRAVVTVDCSAAEALNDLKAWCARHLMEQRSHDAESAPAADPRGLGDGKRWWAEFGETSEVANGEYFQLAIRYVNQG